MSNDSKIYINTNTNSYLDFVKYRDQKKIIENRIDRLESVIKELQIRVNHLENTMSSNRGET
jgi:vacuolar-type H+-ATPase subunit D/Vma8